MTDLTSLLQRLSMQYGTDSVNEKDYDIKALKLKSLNDLKGNLNEVDGYNCDVCRNKGHYYVYDDDGDETQMYCKCLKIRATLKKAKQSGLGDILSECTFDKFTVAEEWQKNIKIAAMNFCKDEDAKWFYIGGQSGSGKTHLCTAIAAHYIKALKDVKYMIWIEDAKRLKAKVNDVSYQDEIDQYKNADVLYIDDLFKMEDGEKPTGADIRLALEIINNRIFNKEKITIISSEKMIGELIDFDEATMGRVFQKTGKYKFDIPKDRNKNYRLRV